MPQLNLVQRAKIIAYIQDGVPIRDVAYIMHTSKNTVIKIKHRWERDGTLEKKKAAGKTRISTEDQDNALIQYLQDNPFQIARVAIEQTNFPGSRITACRRIKNSALKNCVAAKKIKLTDEHKQARIIFSLNNMVQENWNRVVFTDEKVFQSTFNGHTRVYRPRNTRFDEEYIANYDRSGRFSVNVWAWLSIHGLGVCWALNDRDRV